MSTNTWTDLEQEIVRHLKQRQEHQLALRAHRAEIDRIEEILKKLNADLTRANDSRKQPST